ncbi:hypothetical protein HMPREF9999_01095 [Alloprevotella sp. oral taxon 473 str. F0040]|nr:hypothetical protein HMPREF9999_01095 [Alloprevotella sp. oral taxon 473 str. F0040]
MTIFRLLPVHFYRNNIHIRGTSCLSYSQVYARHKGEAIHSHA